MLIINGHLMFPPSEVSCFRDITLYVNVFIKTPVLVQADPAHVDSCYHYMLQTGSFDFVDDIVQPSQETGVVLSDTPPHDIRVRKIWAGNLDRIVCEIQNRLRHYRQPGSGLPPVI